MNPTATLSISQHRLARLTTWVRLWLQMFAAVLTVLTAVDEPRARHALARMARFVGYLVIVRTTMRLHPRLRRPRSRARAMRAGMRRALLGAKVRKQLRGRDLANRFFAILRVMRDFEDVITRQAKRLARGLTCLCPVLPAREFGCPASVAVANDPTRTDTS